MSEWCASWGDTSWGTEMVGDAAKSRRAVMIYAVMTVLIASFVGLCSYAKGYSAGVEYALSRLVRK